MAENQIVESSEETIVPETEATEAAVAQTEETAVADSTVADSPKKSGNFVAGLKEWLRKFIVKLKRKTQLIPLVLTLITSFVYLCMIGTFSQLVELNSGISSLGICMFVATLASILILPLFLNAFPKNKKPVIVFIVAVFVVYALIIAMDVIFLVNMTNFLNANSATIKAGEESAKNLGLFDKSQTCLIAHLVLVSLCVVVFALLPVYKRAINKINTKKVVASNDFSDEIDTSAEV